MDYTYTSTQGEAYKTLLPEEITANANIISLGAVNKNMVPVGVIAAQLKDYNYEIIWLFVREEERRRGVATGLLRELLSIIRKTGNIYPVNLVYDTGSEDILCFVGSLDNFSTSCLARRYLIDAKRRMGTDVMKLADKNKNLHQIYFDQSELTRNRLNRKLLDTGMDLQAYIMDLSDTFIRDLCLCHVSSKIDALILVRALSDNELEVSYAYASNKLAFVYVLVEVLKRIDAKYKDVDLAITTLNPSSEALVKHLFGNATPCERLMRAEWNYIPMQ